MPCVFPYVEALLPIELLAHFSLSWSFHMESNWGRETSVA